MKAETEMGMEPHGQAHDHWLNTGNGQETCQRLQKIEKRHAKRHAKDCRKWKSDRPRDMPKTAENGEETCQEIC